jgi:hypothetical protein
MSKSKSYLFAERYVQELGLKLFPLRPRDKRPLTPRGFKDSSNNIEQIKRWYGSNPRAGVGLPTGSWNGIVVLDFDPRNADLDSFVDKDGEEHTRPLLDWVYEVLGDIPDTWTVETPGGGLHFYFRMPEGRVLPGLKGWRPGVDIQADGAYVCAPPSVHPNGGMYEWTAKPDVTPLAGLPESLYAALVEAQTSKVKRELKADLSADGKIPSGNRNQALTSLAGTMRRRNLDPQAILAALLVENQRKCDPPLDEDEVLAISASIERYEPDEDASPTLVASGKAREISIIPVADMISEPPDIEWIIPGRLARGDCAIIVGPPGCGKSWLTMDLAVNGALGLAIFDEWPVTKPLRVMYVDEENPKDEINRRLHGIFNASVGNGHRPKAALDLEARLQIFEPCQGFTFREKEGWLVPLANLVSQIEPDLIIFDSLTAVSGIMDENKATEVRAFFHDKLYPLRRICNSAILCVHHSNKKAYETVGNETTTKDGQIRGSIDYLGAVDACLFASATKDAETGEVVKRALHQTKQRRDKEPPAVHWRLDARTDEHGKLCIRPRTTEADQPPAEERTLVKMNIQATIDQFDGMPAVDVVMHFWKKSPLATAREIHMYIQKMARRQDITFEDVKKIMASA